MADNYVHNQLRKLGASANIISKPEVRFIPGILNKKEKINAFLYGSHTTGFGFLLATNERLLFVDKKFAGLQVDDIPYERLTGVEYDFGLIYGKVVIFSRAKNFDFKWVKKVHINHFVHTVEKYMHEHKGNTD